MSLSNWTSLFCWYAAELAALVAGASVLAIFFRSPQAGKIIWRTAFTSIALVMLVEVSGLREKMPSGNPKPHHHFVVTSAVLPLSAKETGLEESRAEAAPAPAPAPLQWWPAWLWLAGIALVLTRSVAARIWLAIHRRGAASAHEESLRLIAPLQSAMGLPAVKAQIWPGLRGPVAFGIFHPTIALPPDFAGRFSAAEQQAMLAHEMAHLAARDPLWSLVSDMVIALVWWHPLAWWARRQLQSVSEAAADEASALIPGGPCVLAECLVRVGRDLTATGPAHSLGVGGNGLRSQLAARIACLLKQPQVWRPPTAWTRWTAHVCAIFVALASAVIPIQVSLSGAIVAWFAAATPVRAENPSANKPAVEITNRAPSSSPIYSSAVTSTPDAFAVVTNVERGGTPLLTASATNSAPLSYQWYFNGDTNSGTRVGPMATNPAGRSPIITKAEKPKVKLMIQLVEIAERDSDQIGLDWIFGVAPTNSPTVETSRNWNLLQASFVNPTNKHPKNVVVDRLRTDGQSAVLSAAQFAALRERILNATEDDVLSAPSIIAGSGLQSYVSTQGYQGYVTGVEVMDASPANKGSVSYFTDNLETGFAVDVLSTAEGNGNWRLRVDASVTQFLRYESTDQDRKRAKTKVEYVIPLPHFRLLETTAQEAVALGQTLAIRGPLWAETTTTKGHFFTRTKTKITRQRLYIFVTAKNP